MPYKCIHCGQIHEELFDVSSDRPDACLVIPETERDSRIFLTDNACVIDDGLFFIRGIIELPIIGVETTFAFGVWTTLSWQDFDTYQSVPESNSIGPFHGRLDGRLRCYGLHETRGLHLTVHFPGGGLRPTFILADADHPLVKDQREGISIDRALWIQHQYSPPPLTADSTPMPSQTDATHVPVMAPFRFTPQAGWLDFTSEVEVPSPPWSFAREDGEGALEISICVYTGGQVPNPHSDTLMQLLLNSATAAEFDSYSDCVCEDHRLRIAAATFHSETAHVRQWYFSDGYSIGQATLHSELPLLPQELHDCEIMVRTIYLARGGGPGYATDNNL